MTDQLLISSTYIHLNFHQENELTTSYHTATGLTTQFGNYTRRQDELGSGITFSPNRSFDRSFPGKLGFDKLFDISYLILCPFW